MGTHSPGKTDTFTVDINLHLEKTKQKKKENGTSDAINQKRRTQKN